MNEAEFQKLLETSWRRKLTAEEEVALNNHCAGRQEDRSRWEEELALNRVLSQLPDAPVPSNFTHRVWQEIERTTDKPAMASSTVLDWFRLNWLPRIALGVLLLGGGVISLQQYHRAQIAKDVASVSSAATVPPQWLQDFDAINRLNPPPVDNELLAALQ